MSQQLELKITRGILKETYQWERCGGSHPNTSSTEEAEAQGSHWAQDHPRLQNKSLSHQAINNCVY